MRIAPKLLVALAAGTLSCALDGPRFEEAYLDAFCTYQASCDPPLFRDDAACRAEEAADREELAACTLDPALARACLDALEALSCEGAALNFPADCQPERTYACDLPTE